MKNLVSLINLINKLNSDELKSLLKYLDYYNEKDALSKSKELVKIITLKKENSAINIQQKLYKGVNQFAFNKLINRLKTKVLEVLLFDSNISKNQYPERVRVVFELKKKLIQCDILSLKGLRDDGDDLCRKVISKAEKFELYDIIINALIIRQRFVNIRKKEKEVKLLENQIKFYEKKQSSFLNAQLIYNLILNKINNVSDSSIYYNELVNSINKINEERKINNSNLVTYYYLLLKTEESQINENYKLASEHLNNIYKLLEKKSIYSEGRMGSTLLNIANNYVHLKMFKEAAFNAEKSRMYFPNNIFNQALVDECLFFAYFYQHDYEMSSKIINKLIKLPKTNNIIFSINKWNYFSAVLKFIANDFKECVDILSNIEEIGRDKEGWNINIRLLIIMTRIELGQFESVDLQVANLEKFIKRSIKKRDINIRYILILRLLIKLINSNYNFNEVNTKRKRYIKLLDSDLNYKWKIKGPELIPFHDWFSSKLKSNKQININ